MNGAEIGPEDLQRAVAELAALQSIGRHARQLHGAERRRFRKAAQAAPGKDDGPAGLQELHRLGHVEPGARAQRIQRRGRIAPERGQHANMQRQRDHEAAGGGERMLGPTGPDQRGQHPPQGRAWLQRHPIGGGMAGERAEDAMDLCRLTGLRRQDDDGIAKIQRRIELLRQRDGDGLDAERAILHLRHPVDGVRSAHAQQEGTLAQAKRVGDVCSQLCGRTVGRERIVVLSRHFAINRDDAFGGDVALRAHPFTPPVVRPEISAFCNPNPMITGGRAAIMPAAAIRP
jgi:hypothetical protein